MDNATLIQVANESLKIILQDPPEFVPKEDWDQIIENNKNCIKIVLDKVFLQSTENNDFDLTELINASGYSVPETSFDSEYVKAKQE